MPPDPNEDADAGLQELNLDQPAPDLGARRQQIRQMVDQRASQEFQQAHPFSPFEQPPVPTNRYRQAEATVLEQDRANEMAARQAQVAQRRAQQQAEVAARRAQQEQQKARNAQSEATFRGNGQQFYTDPYGEIQPVLEAGTNRPLYHPGERTVGQDRQGLPAIIQRDKYGQNQYRRPPLRASEDPLEGQLYADLGDGQSVPYMSVDEALKHPDIQVRRQGMVADRARKNAMRAASEEERKNALAPLEGAVTAADLQIKAARDRRDELEQSMTKLTEEIGGAAQTEAETSGTIFKSPTQRATLAKKVNDQRRAQLATLQSEADAIDESLKPRGALSGVKADAESRRAVFKAQAIIATYDDQIALLEDRMKSGGGNPEKDAKTLATMQAARKAISDGLQAHTPAAAPVAAPAEEAPAAPNHPVVDQFLRGWDVFKKRFPSAFKENLGTVPVIGTPPGRDQNDPLIKFPHAPMPTATNSVPGFGDVEGLSSADAVGAINGAADFLSGLTTPTNVGLAAVLGPLAKARELPGAIGTMARKALAAVELTFGAQMAEHAGEVAGKLSVTAGRPETAPGETAGDVTNLALTAGMGAQLGHSAAGNLGPAEPTMRAPRGTEPPAAPTQAEPPPTQPTPTEARVNVGGAEGTIFGEDAQTLAKRREAIDRMSPEEQAKALADAENNLTAEGTAGNVAPQEAAVTEQPPTARAEETSPPPTPAQTSSGAAPISTAAEEPAVAAAATPTLRPLTEPTTALDQTADKVFTKMTRPDLGENAQKPVSIEVTQEETGRPTKLEMPAGEAHKLIESHRNILAALRRCLET